MTGVPHERRARDDDVVRVRLGNVPGAPIVAVRRPPLQSFERRSFRLPPPGRHDSVIVHATVVYTEGETIAGSGGLPNQEPRRWFVKAYRLNTPQETLGLFGHLLEQALLVNQANRLLPGSRLDPPWAMAPVYVVHATAKDITSGPLSTHLGAEVAGEVIEEGAPIWSWFDRPDNPQPANHFLVLSRYLPGEVDLKRTKTAPAIHELEPLLELATGLDACHAARVAHCDVKPANIRCYEHPNDPGYDYVLVDTDSVVQFDRLPIGIRYTPPFVLPELVPGSEPAVGEGSGEGTRRILRIAPDQLRAHDRYAFALVVVAVLAGTSALEEVVRFHEGHQRARGNSMDPAQVEAELAQRWQSAEPGRDWPALARVIASIFSIKELYRDGWLAREWIQQAIAAAAPRSVQNPAPDADLDRWGTELVAIRADLRRRAYPASAADRQVRDAAQRAVMRVARQAAIRTFTITTAVLGVVGVLAFLTFLRGA